ncbi:TPA: hypothetical protein OGU99_000676 [Escherichia coli]|nr:hypothetical protein [Escherichia coli]MED6699235.1 hypothetical protein [Escherichia coli O157]USL83876.1 hypothetical protein A4_209 [Escherichia phage A4]HCQ0858750.1 hypothetical protein [Escherichia coli]
MKLKLNYHGFRLRDDVEFLRRTPGAELFLTEMGVPFKVEHIGDNDCLVYDNQPDINVPWYSEHMYIDMAARYNCTFEITSKGIAIQF